MSEPPKALVTAITGLTAWITTRASTAEEAAACGHAIAAIVNAWRGGVTTWTPPPPVVGPERPPTPGPPRPPVPH